MQSKRRTFGALACVLVVVCLLSCTTANKGAPPSEEIAGAAAKDLSRYAFDPSTELVDRLQKAPDFLLSFLRKMDNVSTYTTYTPSPEEVAELKSTIAVLPAQYAGTLRQRLVGIYFINNFIGSGLTDYVFGPGRTLYFNLVINPEVLHHTISDWMTYRESTVFSTTSDADKATRISVDCGTQYSGLLYILLHETGNMFDAVYHYTPYMEGGPKRRNLRVTATPFMRGIWVSFDTPSRAADFPGRKGLAYYGLGHAPRPHASRAPDLYRGLGQSPFVSLYATMSWMEDFAELTTWYYFTERLHQPYEIRVQQGEKTVCNLEPMKSPLVRDRTGLVAWLSAPPSN